MDREAWQAAVHGVTKVRHDLATKPPPPGCIYYFHTPKLSPHFPTGNHKFVFYVCDPIFVL